jgi:hypothetical protein
MSKTIACTIAALSLLAITDSASAKGCIKGAIVGALPVIWPVMVLSVLPQVARSVTTRPTSQPIPSPQRRGTRRGPLLSEPGTQEAAVPRPGNLYAALAHVRARRLLI